MVNIADEFSADPNVGVTAAEVPDATLSLVFGFVVPIPTLTFCSNVTIGEDAVVAPLPPQPLRGP